MKNSESNREPTRPLIGSSGTNSVSSSVSAKYYKPLPDEVIVCENCVTTVFNLLVFYKFYDRKSMSLKVKKTLQINGFKLCIIVFL